MGLPVLETGTRYELTLPSNGKKIAYRPFLVKEEKIILQAFTTESETEMLNAVKNIAENCTFGELDVDKIPFVDLEWIFLKLRMKSKGEVVEAKYKCKNIIDSEECGRVNELEIDLEKVTVTDSGKNSNNIVLQEKGPIGLVLKYPTKSFAEKWKTDTNNPLKMFDMLADSIESIYDGDDVFYPSDFEKEDLDNFLESLDDTKFKKINEFFEKLPKLIYDLDFKCHKCGHKEKIKLEGLKSFLG